MQNSETYDGEAFCRLISVHFSDLRGMVTNPKVEDSCDSCHINIDPSRAHQRIMAAGTHPKSILLGNRWQAAKAVVREAFKWVLFQ